MLKVGDDLGRYEIIAHLKSGGMATLYLGRRKDPPDNHIFAIKVVHPHYLDDPDLVTMFRDEAGLAVRIRHTNVVSVEEVGADRGRHFIVMEYVHGCSLAQLLQALIKWRRRMSPELAVYVAMMVAEGLHAAHETRGDRGEHLNVVHRDVSPQNILISHTGELRLIDFGIAKSRARVHHSQTGASIRGKLRYMAPEHALGSKNVDRRTDIYALGIVLWEMLTMRPLFWADTDFGVLSKVRDPDVEPPSVYAPRITAALDAAVLKALAPKMEDRPRSAREFRLLLSRAAPLAEALDEEQLAELLDAVLGDQMKKAVTKLPEIVSGEIGDTTNPTRTTDRSAFGDGVLSSLTSPGIEDSELFEESLSSVRNMPDPTNPDGEAAPDGPGVLDYELDEIELEEEEDPTELMSQQDLAEIHGAIARAKAAHGYAAYDDEREVSTVVDDMVPTGASADLGFGIGLAEESSEIIATPAPRAVAEILRARESSEEFEAPTKVWGGRKPKPGRGVDPDATAGVRAVSGTDRASMITGVLVAAFLLAAVVGIFLW